MMEKEQYQPTSYIQDRRIVYERLYQQGLEYLNKKALIQKKIGNQEDPQCTFKPDLQKTRKKRHCSPHQVKSPRKEVENKYPQKVRKSISQGKLGNKQKSPLSRYAIKKEIANISVKGFEKSFLDQARQAAEKRSRQFDERFKNIKKANDQRKILSPRNKLNTSDLSMHLLSPNTHIKQQSISPHSKSPSISYTPQYRYGKPSAKNMKFPLIVDESYLQEAIKICIEKAQFLAKKNDKIHDKSMERAAGRL